MGDDGRVVVLTGASSGIGRAAARRFAAQGADVVVAARAAESLDEVAAGCRARGARTLAVPADVTDAGSVEALAAAAVGRFGRIDVWVDTAAVMAFGRFEDVPQRIFDQVVQTNLLGGATVARVALRQFRAQGHGTLILTSSVLGHIAAPYLAPYVASKWGLRGLARVLRQETRDARDVHVCLVSPGGVDTPIYRSAANYAGRAGRPPPPVDPPEKVARAIVRLADHPRAERSVGLANTVFRLGFTAMPPVYDAMVGPLMRTIGLSREPMGPHPGTVETADPAVDGPYGDWGRHWLRPVGLAAVVGAAAAVALARRRGRG